MGKAPEAAHDIAVLVRPLGQPIGGGGCRLGFEPLKQAQRLVKNRIFLEPHGAAVAAFL